ncbi:MAG TPA: DEAD/DEAH box helicase [Syntrophaceae bacterium]|nr:DEAD/DEAH box helicase [Syntrophaceae bacterium]
MEIKVVSTPPMISSNVPEKELRLFRNYLGDAEIFPFEHQAKTFCKIKENKEVTLIAGTAAGKTLAIAVPLIIKIIEKKVNKAAFLYPTLALLDDQKKVLDRLGSITGLSGEIGYIFGGFSRSNLIRNLNKKIILSTPDAIYWFFQKNIKYSSLLIYGLSQIDEFVLDEAHLFNGLTLRNLEHFFQRIYSLRETFIQKRRARLHVLTATFEDPLMKLSKGEKIDGRSKCETVKVILSIKKDLWDSQENFKTKISEALEKGFRRILVVCNSAKTAHRIFEGFTSIDKTKPLPAEYLLQFGVVKRSDFLESTKKMGISQTRFKEIISIFTRFNSPFLRDIPKDTNVKISLDEVIEIISREIEIHIKKLLQLARQTDGYKKNLEKKMSGYPKLTSLIYQSINHLTSNKSQIDSIDLEEWSTQILGKMEELDSPSELIGKKDLIQSKIEELATQIFGQNELATLLAKKVWFSIHAEIYNQNTYLLDKKFWIPPQIPLKVLNLTEEEKAFMRKEIEEKEISVQVRYVKFWENTDVPVILYTGSMTKSAREGLINLFSARDLPRAVLVSTSAVEVGVDFDAELLITEECEGNSFLQRFGRVGRHGSESEVWVFVNGDTLGRFKGRILSEVSREEFSKIIRDEFPKKLYAQKSVFLDSIHYLINEQMGRIGKKLNKGLNLLTVNPLAKELKAKRIEFSYGLRGTFPSISLKEGITKDPFSLLRYVCNDRLYATNSAFEIGSADMYFTELIFKKALWEDVYVDIKKTFENTRFLFYKWENIYRIIDFQIYWVIETKLIKSEAGRNLRKRWQELLKKPSLTAQMIASLGHFNEIVDTQLGKFLLLHGDIYIRRAAKDDIGSSLVEDYFQNPLVIPGQVFLFIKGIDGPKAAITLLEGAGVANLEEVYYDWDGLRHQEGILGMFLLEKVSGACFYVYERLYKNAS